MIIPDTLRPLINNILYLLLFYLRKWKLFNLHSEQIELIIRFFYFVTDRSVFCIQEWKIKVGRQKNEKN